MRANVSWRIKCEIFEPDDLFLASLCFPYKRNSDLQLLIKHQLRYRFQLTSAWGDLKYFKITSSRPLKHHSAAWPDGLLPEDGVEYIVTKDRRWSWWKSPITRSYCASRKWFQTCPTQGTQHRSRTETKVALQASSFKFEMVRAQEIFRFHWKLSLYIERSTRRRVGVWKPSFKLTFSRVTPSVANSAQHY